METNGLVIHKNNKIFRLTVAKYVAGITMKFSEGKNWHFFFALSHLDLKQIPQATENHLLDGTLSSFLCACNADV